MILHEYGVDIDQPIKHNNCTLLEMAVIHNHFEMLKILIEKGSDPTKPLKEAIVDKNEKRIKLLHNAHAYLKIPESELFTLKNKHAALPLYCFEITRTRAAFGRLASYGISKAYNSSRKQGSPETFPHDIKDRIFSILWGDDAMNEIVDTKRNETVAQNIESSPGKP
jgi:ankyrin repeat protein